MDIIVWELILVAVVGLGLGFWQLFDVNRELKKEADQKTEAKESCPATDITDDPDQAHSASATQAPEQVPQVRPKRDA